MWKQLLPFLKPLRHSLWDWDPDYGVRCWECQDIWWMRKTNFSWYVRHGLFFKVDRQVATFCTEHCKYEWQHRLRKG